MAGLFGKPRSQARLKVSHLVGNNSVELPMLRLFLQSPVEWLVMGGRPRGNKDLSSCRKRPHPDFNLQIDNRPIASLPPLCWESIRSVRIWTRKYRSKVTLMLLSSRFRVRCAPHGDYPVETNTRYLSVATMNFLSHLAVAATVHVSTQMFMVIKWWDPLARWTQLINHATSVICLKHQRLRVSKTLWSILPTSIKANKLIREYQAKS